MQFDPALAARAAFHQAESELGQDWTTAVELEEVFSSSAGQTATDAYEALLSLGHRHPGARAFQAFCIYITWQQAAEQTIPRHFQTGLRLCERFLSSSKGKRLADMDHVEELYESFRAGLGMEEEDDDLQREFKQDTPKGGD